MSALTDLFTSMANKIRSKTGTATTYTPTQMASDGIDDVYAAGIADATTSITPSNASPVSMSANTGYKPTSAGYAISSYNSVTPSNSSPVSLSSGSIYKMGGAGKAVASVTTLTPSDSSPATITSGTVYKASANGKAVASVTDVTPSALGTSFSAGINKMSSAGYAYTEKPSVSITTLWTNASPTGNFDGQEITLSSGISTYDYIRIGFRVSKTNSKEAYVMMIVTDYINETSGDDACRVGLVVNVGGTLWSRGARYVSDTKINFSKAYKGTTGTGATSTANAIPTTIQGVKYNNVVSS